MAVKKKRKLADEKRMAPKDSEPRDLRTANRLEEVVAAVSIKPEWKTQDKLFRPPQEKLQICEDLARLHTSSREHKQALRELVRCVALARICYGDTHWKLAEAHRNLARGYLRLPGLWLQAQQHVDKAKEILGSAVSAPHGDTDLFRCSVGLFHTAACALLGLHKYPDAAENLSKAERLSWELLQSGRIPREEWVDTKWRINLASAQISQGQKRWKEALAQYQEALESAEKSQGEQSPKCIPILKELAGVERALGQDAEALQHLLQAHTIVLSNRPSAEDAAVSAHCVAHAAASLGTPEHHGVAEQFFQESLARLQNTSVGSRTRFLSVLEEYCQFLRVTGQQEKALAVLQGSLEAKEHALGDLSPEAAETCRVLSGANLALKKSVGTHPKLEKVK
ncbi:tetratricopeptide repeat protein 23 [Suncus etruscus]|uniref:tetratricopeptide repeat protein 23 n=1 Tax=Suncus etruscus TaxID=109475 RepID=UPI002110B08A|nr:tetratricopeptide repeat protein 23 [Suncus etruscus]